MQIVRIAGLAALAAGLGWAQSGATYKIDFTVHDAAEAAAATVRHYTLVATPGSKVSLRLGSREPVESGNGQYTYLDVGVSLECSLREAADARIQLSADLDLSGIVQRAKAVEGSTPDPAIGQLKLSTNAVLTPGKPALVGSIDDPVTARKFDVEATVTKVAP